MSHFAYNIANSGAVTNSLATDIFPYPFAALSLHSYVSSSDPVPYGRTFTYFGIPYQVREYHTLMITKAIYSSDDLTSHDFRLVKTITNYDQQNPSFVSEVRGWLSSTSTLTNFSSFENIFIPAFEYITLLKAGSGSIYVTLFGFLF